MFKNIFEQDKSAFKQLRETAIGTKMVPSYAIMLIKSLKEDILSKTLSKSLVWWRYIDDDDDDDDELLLWYG